MSFMRFRAVAALLATGILAMAWAYIYGGGADPGILDRSGPAVRWVLPAAKLVFNIASAGTIGSLVLAAFALPPGGPAYAAALRLAGWSAVVWTTGATVYTGAGFLFIANRSVSDGFGPSFLSFLTEIDAGRSGALAAVVAAAVALSCFYRPGPRRLAVTVMVAFAGLVPLVLKSHASGGADHADSTTSIVVHMAAAAVWLGGLLSLVVLRPEPPGGQLSTIIRRYSTLALICFIALAGSGSLAAWARIRTSEDLVSPYGLIVLAKAAAFIVLGIFGVLHRRSSLKRLERDPDRGGRHFTVLAVAELAFMGAASGMAAGLARTEPPTATASVELDAVLPGPGLWEYVTRWVPDPLWSLVCGFAVFFYLAGVRRLRAEGISWPLHRTGLWMAGVAVLFTVTNGGIHIYQGYLFNAYVLSQMMLTAVVPLLLVPAAPLALAGMAIKSRTDGSAGPKEFVDRTVRPIVAVFTRDPYACMILLAACLIAAYYTPLPGWSVDGQAGYSASTVLCLLTGCLATTAMAGPRAPDITASPPARRLTMVAGIGALYAVWGWKLSTQAVALGRPWYTSVGQPWGTLPAAAPELGGTIMWTLAAITLAATTLCVITSPRGGASLPEVPEKRSAQDAATAAGAPREPAASAGGVERW